MIFSKCRIWEKERRNRICKEFTALVEILPSVPSASTKTLILQNAVKYIKELRLKNDELIECDKKYKGFFVKHFIVLFWLFLPFQD